MIPACCVARSLLRLHSREADFAKHCISVLKEIAAAQDKFLKQVYAQGTLHGHVDYPPANQPTTSYI
jgi:hypothetical protein